MQFEENASQAFPHRLKLPENIDMGWCYTCYKMGQHFLMGGTQDYVCRQARQLNKLRNTFQSFLAASHTNIITQPWQIPDPLILQISLPLK